MKRSKAHNLSEAAKILAKAGGKARSQVLTKAQKQDIAAKGGRAKARKA